MHRFHDDPAGWTRGMSPRRGRGRGRRSGAEFGVFGRGPRAGRGDIRAAILALLTEQPMHGYQIIGELSERSGGVWSPSPGSIYPTLALLQDEGLVRGEEADGRRVFTLTDAGRETAADAAGRPPWEEVSGDVDAALVDLRDAIAQVGAAVRQIARAGGDSQVSAAKRVLSDTRKALYRILAEDDET